MGGAAEVTGFTPKTGSSLFQIWDYSERFMGDTSVTVSQTGLHYPVSFSTSLAYTQVSLMMWSLCPYGPLISAPDTVAQGKPKSIHSTNAQHPHTAESQAPSPGFFTSCPCGFQLLCSFTGDLSCLPLSYSTKDTEVSLTTIGRQRLSQ